MKTLTLNEVARRLGISAPTARKLNIPTVRVGKRDRYLEAALEQFIARGGCRHTEQPAA